MDCARGRTTHSEIDMMNVDMRLKEDAQAAARKKSKKSKKAKRRRKAAKADDGDDEDNGFHFIAYVPACGGVWKMDGMERWPQSLGRLEDDSSWLAMVIPDLQKHCESASESRLEFSLLSVVANQQEEASIQKQDLEKAERLREDWSPLMAELIKFYAEKGNLEGNL